MWVALAGILERFGAEGQGTSVAVVGSRNKQIQNKPELTNAFLTMFRIDAFSFVPVATLSVPSSIVGGVPATLALGPARLFGSLPSKSPSNLHSSSPMLARFGAKTNVGANKYDFVKDAAVEAVQGFGVLEKKR